jgi:hypothetical protein
MENEKEKLGTPLPEDRGQSSTPDRNQIVAPAGEEAAASSPGAVE